jgi:hypothetical protein
MVNRSLPIQEENWDDYRLTTGNLIFKKSEIIYKLERNPALEKHGVHEVRLKYDHAFPIMQLIEQLVKRELVVYHEEEWQLVQYGPNSMIVHQTIIITNMLSRNITTYLFFVANSV